MKARYLLTASAALLIGATVFAQSQNFKLGKWTEIQNAVLQELSALMWTLCLWIG